MNGCYDVNVSRVALAGHSMGAYTTLLAAGVQLQDGSNAAINLTQYHGLRRQNHAASPHDTDPLYDSGAFAHDNAPLFVREISAYIAIGGGTYTGDATLTVIDPTRPNLTGKDGMQQPFMLMSGTNDVLSNTNGQLYAVFGGTPCYHDAVLKPFGVCPSPAYAVIIAGANHITPVSRFAKMSSSTFGDAWTGITQMLQTINNYFTNIETPAAQKDAFTNVITQIVQVIFSLFPSSQNTPGNEAFRLGEFELYSLAFFDTYLSPRYNITGGTNYGSGFLGLPETTHEQRLWVADSPVGFRYSPPTHAFFVKNNAGTPLVQFQSDGNLLVLQGQVSPQQSLSDDTQVKELLIKKYNNGNPIVVAKVPTASDPNSIANLSITGTVTSQVSNLTANLSTAELVIRDAGQIAQIIIDVNGNLKVRKNIYTH
ncbi:MAG: hypothetical protein HZB26_14240 [Candidatus Hydrogenedentes bacterium]|nr:hypothetical protein [Candidatus Hydrogenedentota bacterium]